MSAVEELASTMHHQRSSITLTFRNIEASNALSRANSLLSAGQPDAALRIYTDVLSDTAPAHPCAFLNRSLCYLCLGYPELAANDALRALLATSVARLGGGQHSIQGKQIMTFWNATQLAQQRSELWTMRPTCYVETGLVELLDGDLACLCIRLRMPKRPGFTKSEAIFHDVRMKAWYRLAYALWKCGGGAMKSAIDVLEDASPAAWHEDHKAFDALANRILQDLEEALTTVSSTKLSSQKYMKTNETGSVSESIPATEDLLRLLESRFTFVPRPSYPWTDSHSQHLSTQSQVEQITKAFASVLPCCEVKGVERNGKTEGLCFIAKDDIRSTGPIFKETSAFYVSTSNTRIRDDFVYCEACASKVTIPKSLIDKLLSASRPVSPMSGFSKTEPNTRRSSFSSVLAEVDYDEHNSSPSKEEVQKSTRDGQSTDTAASIATPNPTLPALPLTPPSENKPLYSPAISEIPEDAYLDFQICPCCRKVVFCSSECLVAAAEHYHAIVCDKDLEGCLGKDTFSGNIFPGLPHPKLRKLQALMLGRLFAKADGRDCSPLELEEIWVFGYSAGSGRPGKAHTLTGKQSAMSVSYDAADFSRASAWDEDISGDESQSNKQVTDKGDMLPWSFKNDVFLPLQLLLELGGIDLALDVKRYDGWVINTVRSGIQEHMRATKRPRCEKTFDERGFLSETLFFEPTENDDQDPSAEEDESPWVGSLHPMLSLINVATSKDDANVSIREFSGTVLCTAKAAHVNSSAVDTDEETMQDIDNGRDTSSAQSPESSSQPAEVPAIKAGQVLYRPPEPAQHLTPSPEEQKLLERITALLPYKGGKQTLMRHGSGYSLGPLVPRPLFSGMGGLRSSRLVAGQTLGRPGFVGQSDHSSAPRLSPDENRRPQTADKNDAQSRDVHLKVTDDDKMSVDVLDGSVSVSELELERMELNRDEDGTSPSRGPPSDDTMEEGEIHEDAAMPVDDASAPLRDAMWDALKRSAA